MNKSLNNYNLSEEAQKKLLDLYNRFKNNPFDSSLCDSIGALFIKEKMYNMAFAYLKKALTIDPSNKMALKHLNLLYDIKKIENIPLPYEKEQKIKKLSYYSIPQKILFIGDFLYPIVGGAERSALTILKELSKDGHTCYGICQGESKEPFFYENINIYHINNINDTKTIEYLILLLKPDLILTQLNIAKIAISLAKKHHIPSILFIRSFEYFCNTVIEMTKCDRNCSSCIFSPTNRIIKDIFKPMIDTVDAIVSNSKFIKDTLSEFYGKDSFIVYPVVEPDETLIPFRNNSFILMVNPLPHKGGEIFYKIASQLKQYSFMTTGRGNFVSLENCINYGKTEPLLFLSHAALVLVPSIWPEPFGRIALEAMMNGIPVIASKVGGLPELLGEKGLLIEDYHNTKNWIEKIELLMNDSKLYLEYSNYYLERSKLFNNKDQLNNLKNIINSTLSLKREFSDRRILNFYNKRYKNVETYKFLFELREERLNGLCNLVKKDEKYLDVGCADGAHMEILHRKGINGIGLDLSIPNILRGKEVFPHLKFIHGFAEALPFRDNLVDIVIMGDIIEHLREPKIAIKEALRVAKKGIAICVPIEGKESIEHIHAFHNIEEIKKIFKDFPVDLKWYNSNGNEIKEEEINFTQENPWVYLRAEKKINNDNLSYSFNSIGNHIPIRDEWIDRENLRDMQEVFRFNLTAEIVNGNKILEIACGDGEISVLIAQKKGYEVIGIDISETAIKIAKQKAKQYGVEDLVKFEVRNGEETGYPDNYFDTVIIAEMIEHLKDPHRVIIEALRVLKEGGKLILSVPDGEDPNPDHIRCFFKHSLSVELAQYTDSICWYNLPFKRWLICSFVKKDKESPLEEDFFHNIFNLKEEEVNIDLSDISLPGFNIIGPLSSGDQWGELVRGITQKLIEYGHPVYVKDTTENNNSSLVSNPFINIRVFNNMEMPYTFSLFFLEPEKFNNLFIIPPYWLKIKNRLLVYIPILFDKKKSPSFDFIISKCDCLGIISNEAKKILLPEKSNINYIEIPQIFYKNNFIDNILVTKEKVNIGIFIDKYFDLSLLEIILKAYSNISLLNKNLIIIVENVNPNKDLIFELVKKYNNPQNIILYFEGVLGEKNTDFHLKYIIDIFLYFSSFTYINSLIIKMLSEKKVVITDSNTKKNLPIKDGIISINITSKDEILSSLTTLLENLISQKKERESLANKQYEEVVKYLNYSDEKYYNSLYFLFEKFLKEKRKNLSTLPKVTKKVDTLKVLFQLRPNFKECPGGDTVVLYNLIDGLRKRGVKVEISSNPYENLEKYDLVHLFNTTQGIYIDSFTRNAIYQRKPIAITSLQEDFILYHEKSWKWFNILSKYIDIGQKESFLEEAKNNIEDGNNPPFITSLLSLSYAGIIFTSGEEESILIRNYFPDANTVVAPFGIEDTYYDVDKKLFIEKYKIENFVLCVGRLETRKNQLMLLKALEHEPIPIVFLTGGVVYQPIYAEYCHKFKRKAPTIFIDRIDRELLFSAYKACAVHVLPSWYELPGLVTIEAAASGAKVVASYNGTIRSYLGDLIKYCDPSDYNNIRETILDTLNSPVNPHLSEKAKSFTWDKCVEIVLSSYLQLLNSGNNTSKKEMRLFPINSFQKTEKEDEWLNGIILLIESKRYKEAVDLYEKKLKKSLINKMNVEDVKKLEALMSKIKLLVTK